METKDLQVDQFFLHRAKTFMADEITRENLLEFLGEFRQHELPRLKKYKNYYDGNQEILLKKGQMQDKTKPCNMEVTNFCDNIVNNYQGYLAGRDIVYSSDKDISEIQEILNYNDNRTEDAELLREALIYGRAFELMYIDEEGKQRFRKLDSRSTFAIYNNKIDQELLGVVRFYRQDMLHENKGYYVDVYLPNTIAHYTAPDGLSSLTFVGEEAHYYEQVPVVVFSLNQDELSIFDKVMTLQDKYNKISSYSTDDYEAFCDAYFYFKGLNTMTADEAQTMREKRVIVLKSPDMDAGYITKPDKGTNTNEILKQISEDIHKISNSPDFTDDAFGTSSGVAMQYKLLGFENVAGSIAAQMTKALQKRIELICAILTKVDGESTWRDIEITFTRNLPIDYSSLVTLITQLKGTVSTKTLIGMLPFVSDVDKEIEMVNDEKIKNQEIYGFDTNEEVITNDEGSTD